MEVHLKVKKARIDVGISQTDFAKKIGTSQNVVWRMKNGDKKFVSRPYIDFMLEQGYDLNSLLGSNLSLQKSREQQIFKTKDNDKGVSKIDDRNYIALFPDSISKNFTHFFLNHQKDFRPINNFYLPDVSKNDGAIRVQWDTMYPILKPLNIIIFRKQPVDFESILYGEIYVISLKLGQQEIVTLKRLQHADCDGECVKLVNENPKYQSKDVPLEKIQAMALVKASVALSEGVIC